MDPVKKYTKHIFCQLKSEFSGHVIFMIFFFALQVVVFPFMNIVFPVVILLVALIFTGKICEDFLGDKSGIYYQTLPVRKVNFLRSAALANLIIFIVILCVTIFIQILCLHFFKSSFNVNNPEFSDVIDKTDSSLKFPFFEFSNIPLYFCNTIIGYTCVCIAFVATKSKVKRYILISLNLIVEIYLLLLSMINFNNAEFSLAVIALTVFAITVLFFLLLYKKWLQEKSTQNF